MQEGESRILKGCLTWSTRSTSPRMLSLVCMMSPLSLTECCSGGRPPVAAFPCGTIEAQLPTRCDHSAKCCF